MSAEKDAVRVGLNIIDELVEHADLKGGPLTNLIVREALKWAQGALDAHDTPELAHEAMKRAVEGYAQARAREKFGHG